QQLALFNTATNTAAASVADILAKTYPAWDTEVSGAHAAANAVVPPSGFGVETDSSGTVIYRDATGVRVYPVTGQDSFGSAYWSLSSGGAPIRATYQRVPSTAVDGAGTPLYTNTSDATQKMATAVSPTTVGGIPTIYQSAVNGSPSGEITLNGTKFKTTIILGTCFVETSQTAIGDDVNGTCEKAPGGTFTEPSAASPGTSPAIPDVGGYTPLVRAIVVVEWTAGCSAMQPCSYSLSSEFLPNIKDLKWRIGLP
ncbi:MAG: hypothetical protein J7484_14090, partial [Microbacterium sp.]|nr:hypothetical protein [Microbacterium sp.]